MVGRRIANDRPVLFSIEARTYKRRQAAERTRLLGGLLNEAAQRQDWPRDVVNSAPFVALRCLLLVLESILLPTNCQPVGPR